MERQGMSKAKLAELMHTSRAQVDRIFKASATRQSRPYNALHPSWDARCGSVSYEGGELDGG
jgi:hypothetical protein